MKSLQKQFSLSIGVFILISVLFAVADSQWNHGNAHWWSVLPPLIAVTFAMGTHKLFLSLIAGVLAGGFLAEKNFFLGLFKGVGFFTSQFTSTSNLLIAVFILFILPMITVMMASGGVQKILEKLARYANSRGHAQFMTFIVGIVVFIDDYANTMLVGSTMRPMTDRYRVSREKLAFLVDATAAPISGIAFLSTWIGYEVGLFDQVSQTLNLGRDGYSIFFDVIGFRFYCILMIVFVIVNILSKRDYGSMYSAEKRAFDHGDLWHPEAKLMGSARDENSYLTESVKQNGKMASAVIPVAVLFGAVFCGLWISGGSGQSIDTLFSFNGWKTVLAAADSIKVLAVASPLAFLAAVLSGLIFSKAEFNNLAKAAFHGLKASFLPITILFLAWSLKSACDSLQTSHFLVETFGQRVSPLFYPFIVFILSGLVAFATGTSWGTMAILIPTVAPLAIQLDGGTYGLMTMMTLGAVLDGAIFGDHCSPISDTTIMSSISSSCDHIHHVRTQLPYAMTTAIIAGFSGYLLRALGVPLLLDYIIATGLIIVVFVFFGKNVEDKRLS